MCCSHKTRMSVSPSTSAIRSRNSRANTDGRSGFFSTDTVSSPTSELMRASSSGKACSTSGKRFCNRRAASSDSFTVSSSTSCSMEESDKPASVVTAWSSVWRLNDSSSRFAYC